MYTPQFSDKSTISVRRLSWYLGKPMTKTVDVVMEILPYIFDSKKVCKTCKDKKCKYCAFNNPKLKPEEQIEIFEKM